MREPRVPERFGTLTRAEAALLEKVASGMNLSAAGRSLGVKPESARKVFKRVREKLDAATTEEAVSKWKGQ